MKLDHDAIAKAIGLPVKHVPMLISAFIEEAQEILQSLDAAISQHAWPEVSRLAHSIKGSSGNLRLERIYEACRAMEFAAKEGDSSFDYEATFATIKADIQAIEL